MKSVTTPMRRFTVHLLAASVIALSGCSMAPVYERPAAPIPTAWSKVGEAADMDAQPSSAAKLDWQSFIADESLRKLVELALSNNRDLRQTLLNVEAARAQYRVQRADRLPGIDAQGSGSRQRMPADLNPSGQAGVQSTWQAGVGMAAFELDLFGRVRNLSQAA
ncbi:TolC family protein, partial [Serratia marcescens]